ncbi:toll/interleukin-1 receptor domain-containing protein [Sulfuriflexus mobilis]|uniref:toll/interleukin-1 receptor domain-containing protein n=1 Tax=Sulfuriflexus mobilis TaxID=1811807 RepID=UPI000F82BEC3|nr:toll/interleukin-1 receptor domain-containing protein [Sulfuriflexus mobilis]
MMKYIPSGDVMRVFISWSGEASKIAAMALRDHLPEIIQALRPWCSTEDIDSGTVWNAELIKALNESVFGIICVTHHNQNRPWLMYESGALAHKLDPENTINNVCPLLIGMENIDLNKVLGAFQSKTTKKEEVYRLVVDINKKLNSSDRLREGVLERSFERVWPDLNAKLGEATKLAKEEPDQPKQLTTPDMLSRIMGQNSLIHDLAIRILAENQLHQNDILNNLGINKQALQYLQLAGAITPPPELSQFGLSRPSRAQNDNIMAPGGLSELGSRFPGTEADVSKPKDDDSPGSSN